MLMDKLNRNCAEQSHFRCFDWCCGQRDNFAKLLHGTSYSAINHFFYVVLYVGWVAIKEILSNKIKA
jgi:hypothetical protein